MPPSQRASVQESNQVRSNRVSVPATPSSPGKSAQGVSRVGSQIFNRSHGAHSTHRGLSIHRFAHAGHIAGSARNFSKWMQSGHKAPSGESLVHRASDISASFLHDLLSPMGKILRYFGPRLVEPEKPEPAADMVQWEDLSRTAKDDIDMAARQSPLTGWIPVQAAAETIQPPKSPAPGSFQRTACDASSNIDRHVINRPLQGRRPAGPYEQLRHRQIQGPSGSSRQALESFAVPIAASSFLVNESHGLSSSSELSDEHAVRNILDSSGSQWCSSKLRRLKQASFALGAVAAKKPSNAHLRLKSSMSHLFHNRRGSHQDTVDFDKASIDSPFSRSSGSMLLESEKPPESFESTAEWVEVTFQHPVLLSCLVVKWGRHFAQHYTVLTQWHARDESGAATQSPYWLPMVTPPVFSLPRDEQCSSGSPWCVVHVEHNGSGGTDIIRFGAGPVCTKAIRLRMTKPGNLIGALAVTDCFYSICGLGAVPFTMPVGNGLRAEYFQSLPDATYGFHNLAEASYMEPSRKYPSLGSSRERPTSCDVDPHDGRFGPAPEAESGKRCQFASYTGWLRIDQCGVYELSIRLDGVKDPANYEERVGTCCVWINLGLVTAEGELGNSMRIDGTPCTFSRWLHAGCHVLAIQISLEDVGVPDVFITYKGPDTRNEARPLPASVLAPPTISDASMKAISFLPGAASGLANLDPACRHQAANLLAYEVDKFQVAVTPSRSHARAFVGLCSEGNESHCEIDKGADDHHNHHNYQSNHDHHDHHDHHDPVPANTASKAFTLFRNGTRLSVRVLAEDLRTMATYIFSVQCIDRDISRDCVLSELTVSTPCTLGGVCLRTCDIPQTGAYDVINIPELPYMALTVSISVTVPNQDAHIYIAKGPLKHRLEQEEHRGKSGAIHRPIPLHVGRNIFYIRVLSPDKRLVRNWTVDVKRSASSDATMKVISIEPCGFRQYLPSKNDYRIQEPVPFGCNAVHVWVEANHADAKVYVGVDDPRCCAIKRGVHRFDHHCQESGMRVPLRVAWNIIYVRVVAMDNTTSKTYAFHCARRPLSLLSGLVSMGQPVNFDCSVGVTLNEENLKAPELCEQKVWSLGKPIWQNVTSESCMSQWVQMSFDAPVLIAGIRVHWSSIVAIAPVFEVHVRGLTPWELTSQSKGPLPRCMPALKKPQAGNPKNQHRMPAHRQSKSKSHRQQVTRSRWRIDHMGSGVGEVLDLVDVQHLHFTDHETEDCGWRLFANGVGNHPVALPAAVCAEELRIKVVGFEEATVTFLDGQCPISIDGIELVPMQVSEVGVGFVGEFFLGNPERLSEGGRPDFAALEPSLDGSDTSAMSVRVPAQIGQVPWAAQYSGLLDVREPGEYMFWVETNRFRHDQTLLWRLCIDGTILKPPDPRDAMKKAWKKKKGKPRLKRYSSKEDLSERDSLFEHSESKRSSFSINDDVSYCGSGSDESEMTDFAPTLSDSSLCSPSSSITPSHRPSSSGRSERKGSEMRSRAASRACSLLSTVCASDGGESGGSVSKEDYSDDQRMSGMSATSTCSRRLRKGRSKNDTRGTTVKGQGNVKSKNLTRRWLTVNCIAAMSQGSYLPEGMQVPLLPGGHYVRLEVLAIADDAVQANEFNFAEGDEDDHHSLVSWGRQSTKHDDDAKSQPGSTDGQEADSRMGGNAGIQVNLAYKGPDTNGHVVVVPPRSIAPMPEDDEHYNWRSLLRPTLPLNVHAEVAESWSQAAVAMSAWLEDEAFLQQVHGMSAHSIEHEDDWRGKCQIVVVYSNTQHGGQRLCGLRFLELEYSEERIPSSHLDAVAELLQNKRFVGMASSTDQFYDHSNMKRVIQNVLIVWYLEDTPSLSVPVLWKVGLCETPADAANEVASAMNEIGLCRSQLLSMTVHPVRPAGTAHPHHGDIRRSSVESEKYEWIAFFFDPQHPESEGCSELLSSVHPEVWQTQNTWKWHFDKLKESTVTTQTIVAYTTTSEYVNGRCQCVQIALWQVPEVDLEICGEDSHSHGTRSDLDEFNDSIEDFDALEDGEMRVRTSIDATRRHSTSPTGRKSLATSPTGQLLEYQGNGEDSAHSSRSPSRHEQRRVSSRRSHSVASAMPGRMSRTGDILFASDCIQSVGSLPPTPSNVKVGQSDWSGNSRNLRPIGCRDTPSTCLGESPMLDTPTTGLHDDDRPISPADSARIACVNLLHNKIYPQSIRVVNSIKSTCVALLQRHIYPKALAKSNEREAAACRQRARAYLSQLYERMAMANDIVSPGLELAETASSTPS